MPELPEVETVRRGLAGPMEGAVIKEVQLNRKDLRFPFPGDFSERLEGRRITSLGRRAKYLLVDLDSGDVLIMHLGMSGSFRVDAYEEASRPGEFHHPKNNSAKHDHVIFKLDQKDRDTYIVYNDPRRFGFMDLIARPELPSHPFFKSLGLEPTGNELDGDYLSAIFEGRKTPLKAALLDQRMIAGLGNIYVCEALWRSALSPRRKASTICRKGGKATERSSLLAQSIRNVIDEAIAAGGSSLRDHRQTDGSLGYFQHSFSVYDREGMPCERDGCGGVIKRIVQSGRSTFYCPSCQK